MTSGRAPLILFVASLALFGTNGLLVSQIDLPSNQIVLLRTLIGSSFLLSVSLMFRFARRSGMGGRNALYIILSGASMGVSWILLFEAYELIGVGLASILYYCGPVLVLILSPFIFREKVTPAAVVCFAVVASGAFMVCFDDSPVSGSSLGYIYGIGSAIAHATMIIFTKKISDVDPLWKVSFQTVSAFVVVLSYSVLISSLPLHIEGGDWLPIVFLGVVNTGVGCLMYFSSMPLLKAQTISVWGYTEPMVALLTGFLILGESASGLQFIGVLTIIVGSVCMELLDGRRRRLSTDDSEA